MSSPNATPSQASEIPESEKLSLPQILRSALSAILDNKCLLVPTATLGGLTGATLAFRTALLFPSVQEPWNDSFKPDLPNPEQVSFLVKYPNSENQRICPLPKSNDQPLFLVNGSPFDDCVNFHNWSDLDVTSIYNRYALNWFGGVDDHFEATFEAVDYKEIDPDHLQVRLVDSKDVYDNDYYFTIAYVDVQEYLVKCNGEGRIDPVPREMLIPNKDENFRFNSGNIESRNSDAFKETVDFDGSKYTSYDKWVEICFEKVLETGCKGKTVNFDREKNPDTEFGIFEVPTEVYSLEGLE